MDINELMDSYKSQSKEQITAYKISEQLIIFEGQIYKKLHQADLDLFEEEEKLRSTMAELGSRTSERKKRSSAENGKLGGRPRKQH